MASITAKNIKILFLRTDGQFAVNLRNLHVLEYLRSGYAVDEYMLPKEELFGIPPLKPYHMLRPSNLKAALKKLGGADVSIHKEHAMDQFIKNVGKIVQRESEMIARKLKNFDCMHATDIFTGSIAQRVNKITGMPYVFDLHDIHREVFRAHNSHPRKIRLYDGMEREIVRSARVITCVGDLAKTHLSYLYDIPLEKIFVIPNGTEDTGFKAVFRNPFRVIFSGNLHHVEGVIDFIKAKELLPDDNIEFYLLGDGDEREFYLSYINKNGLDIAYLGLKKWRKAMREYSKMQAGVTPGSDHIGRRACCPMKVIDYAVCGLPVIIPGFYDFAKYIEKYDAGIVTKDSSAVELKNAIRSLSDKDTWNKKSRNAREMALSRFLWKDVLKPFDAIYG